ncbi:hypothetical protein HDU98_003377 [Podochytrium sp. JEL0797]|nr:hypothetical protein HDU98_003377 [Podochytrium sp. JEL0797]
MAFVDVATWHSAMIKLADAKTMGRAPFPSVHISELLQDKKSLLQADRYALDTPESKCTSVAVLARHLTDPYFLVSPEEFIFSHIPKEDVSSQQYLSTPLTHQEWIQLPYLREPFFANGMRLVSATGHITASSTCLLSFLEISDDYLEITIEVSRAKFEANGGIFFARIKSGTLKSVPTEGRSLAWHDHPPHLDSLHETGGSDTVYMLVHSTQSPNRGKKFYTFRAYVPHGHLICYISVSNSITVKSTYRALEFRVRNRGPGKSRPGPKIYSGSVEPVDPLVGQLTVGQMVRFRAQGKQDAVVWSPSRKIFKMIREGDFQVADVKITESGEWTIGHENADKSLSSGGAYWA